jgi:hypothetical protein
VVEKDSTAPWGAILAAIGREDIANASSLLDRIRRDLVLKPDSVATWLTADAVRWFPADESIALRRLNDAFESAGGTPAGGNALLVLTRYRIARAEEITLLDSVPAILDLLEPSTGDALGQARYLVQTTTRMKERYDSLDLLAPQGDMGAFLVGEALRDSLRADRLAARVWRRILNERPDSPYAPKAVLAMAALAPGQRDSLAELLRTRYPGSPYLIAASGADSPGFRALEDSLARYARALRNPARPAGRNPRAPAATPARPVQ